MKKLLILLVILFCSSILANAKPKSEDFIKESKTNFFIENKGQWAPEVKYLAKTGGMNAWITDYGIVYDFYKIEYNERLNIDSLCTAEPRDWMEKRNENARRRGHVIKMSFIQNGTQSSTVATTNKEHIKKYLYEVQCKNKLESYYNYFIGNDSTKWANYVGLYKEVIIKNVFE